MPDLKSLLQEKIRRKGSLSFAEFMEEALYHPRLGYYSKNSGSPDYYTSADVHPVFAGVLAHFLAREYRDAFSSEKEFHVAELGAGSGKLCAKVLEALKEDSLPAYQNLRYLCVERSPARRKSAKEALEPHRDHVRILEDFKFRKAGFSGVIFSNELFDALPFHRVKRENGKLLEVRVQEDFRESLIPASRAIQDYFARLGAEPREGAYAEAQIEARRWMESLSLALNRGSVLSIDYGHESAEMFSELRALGTALCHYRNRTNRDFYVRAGEQDITCHVNFSALIKAGETGGLSSRLMTQTRFVIESGFESAVQRIERTADPKARLRLSSAVKSLIHPEGMGGTFKVLLQKKG